MVRTAIFGFSWVDGRFKSCSSWKVLGNYETPLLVGGLEHEWIMTFHYYWEFHHPN